MSRYTIDITPDDFNRGYIMYVLDRRLGMYIAPTYGGFQPSEERTPFMKGSDGGEIKSFALALVKALSDYEEAKTSHILDEKHRLSLEFGTAFKESRGD